MLGALVGCISECHRLSLESLQNCANNLHQQLEVRDVVVFILNDNPGEGLLSDRLWPQLWAMQLVEPLVSDLVDDIYAAYIAILEKALVASGKTTPRAEALFLTSLLEGSTIFMGSGRRQQGDAMPLSTTVLEFIDKKYGQQK